MKKSFSTLEIAKYCHVTYRTVANWIDEGKIISFKTAGGNRKVLKEHLIAFLENMGMPLGDLVKGTIRVFVIDDDNTVNSLIKDTLESDDRFAVEVYTNPEEAMLKIGIEKPALILLDIQMPKMDGYAFYKALQRSEQLKDIKVVFISGAVDKEKFKQELGQMASKVVFLNKPIEPDDLIAGCEKALA